MGLLLSLGALMIDHYSSYVKERPDFPLMLKRKIERLLSRGWKISSVFDSIPNYSYIHLSDEQRIDSDEFHLAVEVISIR